MNSYLQYSIRCISCNGLIAPYVPDFNRLLQAGTDQESALNELHIMRACCRIAMINPVHVFHNVEDRRLVEGIINIDSVPNETDTRLLKLEELGTILPIGQGLDVEAKETHINIPDTPHIPVYNPRPGVKPLTIDVGSGKKTTVMDGRTYMAV